MYVCTCMYVRVRVLLCSLIYAWQRNFVAGGIRWDKLSPTCRQPPRLLQHNNTGTQRLVQFLFSTRVSQRHSESPCGSFKRINRNKLGKLLRLDVRLCIYIPPRELKSLNPSSWTFEAWIRSSFFFFLRAWKFLDLHGWPIPSLPRPCLFECEFFFCFLFDLWTPLLLRRGHYIEHNRWNEYSEKSEQFLSRVEYILKYTFY